VEFGEVLVPLQGTWDSGEILRVATQADESADTEAAERIAELLTAAEKVAEELRLPLTIVDGESTLDHVVILHVLPWSDCDAAPLSDELAARFGVKIRLLDLSRVPASRDPAPEQRDKGCGKPGCGTESGGCTSCGSGGGCSSGSCSRGSVHSADELTAHFADLRRKMEAARFVRMPLN
jgi:hypothetical protein